MSALLRLLRRHTPPFIAPLAQTLLFRATAYAFECPMPSLRGLSSAARLQQFALFTAEHAEAAIRNGADADAVAGRLYERAHALGRWQGRLLGIRTVEETMACGRILYGLIGIDFRGDSQGKVAITRCYFSSYYSPQVCRLMSAMDRGLFAGLSGDGQLVFNARITEGQDRCQAQFTVPEQTK